MPRGKISHFMILYSIEILPGPVSNKLTAIDINNNSNSYPPTNPSLVPRTYNYSKSTEISWSIINLESILQTKKPVLVNDLVNEPGINVDWLIKENVRSYAGYPLNGKDRIIGVLEIFNNRVFSPRDLEIALVL